MVYINGQDWAVDASLAPLSDDARARIAAHGPYTQDFARVFPILQPHMCQSFMDELLIDTSALLAALGQAPTVRDFVVALLSRPNVDPGGPTYTTFLTPLLECDTKSYNDMRRIVDWAEAYCGGVPLVLNLWGDGQSVLRLRDLKRLFPWEYRHVLVGNGPFHSSAHFQFACCYLWDRALLHRCWAETNKLDILGPDIKNLEHNSADHSLQGNLAVVVAIYVFLVLYVQYPSPDLLLRNPALYASMVQNATGIILIQYLRHAGLPIMWWQRTCRSGRQADGIRRVNCTRTCAPPPIRTFLYATSPPVCRLDKLHALAIHIFRTAHKTSSSQISLLHLISVFGTHPELRPHLRSSAFVSPLGNVGSNVGCDRSLEMQNDDQKARNTGQCILNALHFTPLMQAMSWATRMWRRAVGGAVDVDPGFRTSIVQEVEALVALLVREVPTDLQTPTTVNTLWHTGQLRQMFGGSLSDGCRPHELIWAVSHGTSRGKWMLKLEDFGRWFHRHIREHMFYM
jgi:hypothetical protein